MKKCSLNISCQGVFLKNFSNPEGFNARGTTVVLSANG